VRKGLGLKNFFVLGHSWGAGLAQLYAAKFPTHLKGLILSNPAVSIRDTAKLNTAQREWGTRFRDAIKNTPGLKELPMATYDSVMRGIIPFADSIQFARLSKLAIQARDYFLRNTSYTLPGELPEPVRRSRSHSSSKTIPESFDQQSMKYDWVSPRGKIKCPVLIIGGTHDKMFHHLYPDMKNEFTNAKVQIYMCQNSGHLSMWDDTEHYFSEVKRFLKEVENNSFKPGK
jgi:proline iminopeptidase